MRLTHLVFALACAGFGASLMTTPAFAGPAARCPVRCGAIRQRPPVHPPREIQTRQRPGNHPGGRPPPAAGGFQFVDSCRPAQ